jgi:hypothetical protein
MAVPSKEAQSSLSSIIVRSLDGRSARPHLRNVLQGREMPEYRLYAITSGERQYLGPRNVIRCANDAAAIKFAEQWAKQYEVEVWENARFVARVAPRAA